YASCARLDSNTIVLHYIVALLFIQEKNNTVHITGHRLFRETHGHLQLSYQPDARSFQPEKASWPYFLTERYHIFTKRRNRIKKGTIYHNKWLLQQATLSVGECQHIPFPVTSSTFSHYSAKQSTFLYPF